MTKKLSALALALVAFIAYGAGPASAFELPVKDVHVPITVHTHDTEDGLWWP